MGVGTKKQELRSSKSALDFSEYVWPVIRRSLGGGGLICVEGTAFDKFKFQLDRIAGIDAWQVDPDAGIMRGLACRVQYTNRPFLSFSIRKKSGGHSDALTEFDKRKKSIRSQQGLIYPALTCQAYLQERPLARTELLAVAVCWTRDLINICTYMKEIRVRINQSDGSQFYIADWDFFRKENFPLLVLGSKVKPRRTDFFKIKGG